LWSSSHCLVSPIASGERQNRIERAVLVNEIQCDATTVDHEADESHEEHLSEAEELFESLKDTIAGLFRLAMTIRKSSPRDRYDKAMSGTNPFGEAFDVAHVGQKFPKLALPQHTWLQERLGRALTQRRRYLQYAREHRRKLASHCYMRWNLSEDDRYLE
jgi:hypothetical protein